MADKDVTEFVDLHFVIPSEPGNLFDAHTHGLETFDHKEIQVLVPGFCRRAAFSLLANHAEAVVNGAERFAPGETVGVDGVICGYEEVPGDLPGDPTRLRIVDIPGGCRCRLCDNSNEASGHSE